MESHAIRRARRCIASCESLADPPAAPDISAEMPRSVRLVGFGFATLVTAALTAAWFAERGDPDHMVAAAFGALLSCVMILAGRHFRRLRDEAPADTAEIPSAPEAPSRALSS